MSLSQYWAVCEVCLEVVLFIKLARSLPDHKLELKQAFPLFVFLAHRKRMFVRLLLLMGKKKTWLSWLVFELEYDKPFRQPLKDTDFLVLYCQTSYWETAQKGK